MSHDSRRGLARFGDWRGRDRGAEEARGIGDNYKVGIKITVSREPALGKAGESGFPERSGQMAENPSLSAISFSVISLSCG
jgi:hypothetical protein